MKRNQLGSEKGVAKVERKRDGKYIIVPLNIAKRMERAGTGRIEEVGKWFGQLH